VRPTDINDAGWIVGYMGDPRHAFVWDGQQYIDLGIPPGGTFSEALAINNAGQVVGNWGNNVSGPNHGFYWHDGILLDLASVLGTAGSSANDISETGWVAGGMGTDRSAHDWRGYLWREGESVEIVAPVAPAINSSADVVNDVGDLCGGGRVEEPNNPIAYRSAFATVNGVTSVIPPVGGQRNNFPKGINNAGVVVGYTYNPGVEAFIWCEGLTSALEDLIDSGVRLNHVTPSDITNAGKIAIGAGTYAAVLNPVYSDGDLNRDCRVDLRDVYIVLSNFGCLDACDGDADGDGDVDLADLAIVLASWTPTP